MKRLLPFIIWLAVVQTANAQSFNPQLAAMLQDTLNFYVASISNIKGMSASVFLPGQGMWQGATGVSYTGQPITTDMEFGIASNTKLFVAAAMLKLAENNIISLNDSLSDWLPAYPNINPNITIRQLLNHTSGVQDPIFLSPWMDTIMAHPTRVFTPIEVLSWVGAPLFAAGTSWEYSNVNYILAGRVAQSATGIHISQIIRDSILTPLNLNSTFYDVEEPEVGVISHRWFNTIDYNDTSRVGLNTAGGCAGSLFSTSRDMAKWYNALMTGQVLSPASFAELTTFVNTFGAPYTYGLGLENRVWFGHTTYGHGGRTWGYKSRMIYDPCMGVVVCGLVNSDPAGMDGVTVLLHRVLVNHVPGCGAVITGLTTVCQGQNSVTYTVSQIANATTYVWTLPSGATGISSTNSITVNYGISALSGNITVKGINNYGEGNASTLAITVNDRHSIACGGITISGTIHTEAGTPVSGVSVALSGSESGTVITDANGTYSIAVVTGGNYVITPSKSNDVSTNNGITTLDITLIRRHVLGILPLLDSPYKIIAADGNNSSSISTTDIPLIRVVVLNNTLKFPPSNSRLWEFVSSYNTPTNPFPFVRTRTYSNLSSNQTNQDFIGVKIGDVNNSWNPLIP